MFFSKNRFMGCLSIMLLGLAGCAQIPADQYTLAQQDVTRTELAANIKLAQSGWPEAHWWTGYADEQLNQLIAQALNKGPSLQVAAVRIASARAALKLDSADQGVNVSLDAASNR
ncbi:MAG: hypothetical protein P4L87_18025, partial [Formivibrio sp.]|nr:hypothetical protein [Formivibrio sp.]